MKLYLMLAIDVASNMQLVGQLLKEYKTEFIKGVSL